MSTFAVGVAAGAALVLGFASPAAADDRPGNQKRVEVSADGHVTAVVEPGNADGLFLGGQSGVVPYGSKPDWNNVIRRQVGGLQAADMNNNGLIDVVAALYHSQSFPPYDDWRNLIYFNTGSELESVASWVSTDEVSTGDIQVGDLNNNGHMDVFAANGGFAMASSRIYWGGPDGPSTSPGWFSTEPGAAWNNYALPVDLSHDGYLQIVTANQGNSQFDPFRPIYIFDNDAGTIETTPSWQSAEESIQGFVAAADYDNNGWQDLAISKWVNFETGIYRNVQGAVETTPTWTTGQDTADKGTAWADITGNGYPDLAVGTSPTTLYANTEGDLRQAWQAEGDFFGHRDMRFADVTGNGQQDLIEIHFSNRRVNIYANESGSLTNEPAWSWQGPSVGTAVTVGDINGNGQLDLIVGNSGEPSIFVFYADVTPEPCPGDLTGDGMVGVSDLLVLIGAWGPCDDPKDCPADLTGDGTVGVSDLLVLIGNWGPCD